MNAITAASIMSKEVDDLALDEVVQASLVFGAILMAVLLAFGLKTYVHWRRHANGTPADQRPAERDEAPSPASGTRQLPAPRIEVLSALGDLRRTGALNRGLEDSR
ncbi:hypothetical protein [Glutamicibacter sp. Je.9.36]|uniref:hypothetical protein n=1 Tax=Glutamicibacter sp. Je.9.36 TaxID=3142837 RepID=UPI003DA9C7A2